MAVGVVQMVRPINDVLLYTNIDGFTQGSHLVTIYPYQSLIVGDASPDFMRVEAGEKAWHDRQIFRTFHKFAIATGTSQVIRATVPGNIILRSVILNLVRTEILLETVVGGTPAGVFGTPLPTFNLNNTSGAVVPASTVTLDTGGTHTGGTTLDLLWGKSGTNAQFAVSVGAMENDRRGVGPGTYYFRLVNTDGAQADGVFKATWEELL